MNRQNVEKTITEYLKHIFEFSLKWCKSIHDAEYLSQEIAIKAFRMHPLSRIMPGTWESSAQSRMADPSLGK